MFKPLVEEGELDLGMNLTGNRGLLDLNRTDGVSKEGILEEGSRKQGQKSVRQIRQRPEAKGEIEEESEEDEKREDDKLEDNKILVTLLPSPFKTTDQTKTKKRLSNTTFLLQSTKPLNIKKLLISIGSFTIPKPLHNVASKSTPGFKKPLSLFYRIPAII